MSSRSPDTDLVGSTRTIITRRLGHGHPTIRDVAAATGINVRTLQRRLAGHGLTHRGLVDEVRLETARRLLEDRSMTLAGIAAALGYSDPAHFTRAFARWTSTTARAHRRRAAQERPCPRLDPPHESGGRPERTEGRRVSLDGK